MMIEIQNLTKKINQEELLKNINIKLLDGKIYGFVGRNGSGKSMLFKTICGFINPTTGKVLVNGIDIYKENTFPEDTRALIEKPNFIGDLSGLENLKNLAQIQNKINEKDILKYMEIFGLLNSKDKAYKKYSLGMKQKLGIIQVLMEDPKILILDEPFNGLEEQSVELLRNILLEEKNKGKLIIIASHIKDDIDILADEIYKMDAGEIVDVQKR